MYVSRHVSLTLREPMTRFTCALQCGFRWNGGGHFCNTTEHMLHVRVLEEAYDPNKSLLLEVKTG